MLHCPNNLDGANVFSFCLLREQHRRPEPTSRHVILPPEITGLAVCQYENDGGLYLFYCDEKWNVQNDTWHESLDKAKEQAEFEYPGTSQLWVDKLESGYRLSAPKLVGVQGATCWGPQCNATVSSTGRLEFSLSSQPSWHLEFSCPSHGLITAFVANLEPLVMQILQENGFDHDET